MRKQPLIAVALLGLAAVLGSGGILLQKRARADEGTGPLPPVPPPPDLVVLEPVQQLGKYMIFDTTMSDPPGYACVQCHAYSTGFTTGLSSVDNLVAGVPPGVIPGRWDNRRAYTYGYAVFSPEGPYYDTTLGVWIGGNFWDGRAYDSKVQAMGPPINPNEMNNTPVGTAPDQYPPVLLNKLMDRPYTPLIKQLYGNDVFTKYTPFQLYNIWGEAIASYEASGEVCQFSSKYDASKYGVPAPPPDQQYTLTASEERGRAMYFGTYVRPDGTPVSAQCFACHSSANLLDVVQEVEGKELFTMYCFANIGVPKNPGNPYYEMVDPISNPTGYNPLGKGYIDYGLGGNAVGALYPIGTKFFNTTPGDIPQFRGLFLTPTTRNTDLRPSPKFIKAYFHNGWAKSLKEVVHFYNTRNVATNKATGQTFVFDLRHPETIPPGFHRNFPAPEVIDNVQNVAGYTPAQAAAAGTTGVTAENGQVGNLGLTASEEADLVNFLMILSDSYTAPNPVGG
jgi:cytochrome c peroxidase